MKKVYVTFLAIAFCLNAKAQIITTFAGNGTAGYSGDGGQATAAKLYLPTQVSIDGMGNIYTVDQSSNHIRKVNTAGIISTVAGNGIAGYSGDNGPATAAKLNSPAGVTVDNAGNIYIADYGNHRIRMVNTMGTISTIAGNGTAGYSGDNILATTAQLNYPIGVSVDVMGNIYIADPGNRRIRKINSAGTISTLAGNGTAGYSGDSGPATAAELSYPYAVTQDMIGNVYIADQNNNNIRKVNTAGIINTLAGTGAAGYSGDNGPATAAKLYYPTGIAVDIAGNIYIADETNQRIRKVNTTGTISTIAGNGTLGFTGDNGPATNAELHYPAGVVLDATGNLYIADSGNNRVRMVNAPLVITVNSAAICAGDTATLTASGATTYSWSPATSLSATTGSMVTASPTVTTTYTVVGTTGASTVSTAVTVSVNPLPSYSLTGNAFTICDGGSQNFSISGAITYTWAPALSLTGANTANPTASPTTTTVYSVTGTNSSGCTNTSPATVTVNVVPPPNLIVSSNSYTICNGSSQGLSVIGASTYTWSPASFLNNPTIANPTASPTTTTIYTVSGMAAGCGPSAPVTVTVVVSPSPTITVSGGGANFQTVCAGGFISPINFSVSPAGFVSWANSNTAIGLAPSGSGNISGYTAPAVTAPTMGTITVNATASGTGCQSTNATQLVYNITINPLPTVTCSATPDTILAGSTSQLNAVVFGGAGSPYTYTWVPAASLSITNTFNPVAAPIFPTCYTVVTSDANGCENMCSICVDVNNSTGINKLAGSNDVIIYPNPNTGSFNIELNSATKQTMQVYDVTGKMVLSQTISGKTSIDASNLNEGVYNISLISQTGALNKKLIIVK